MTKVKVKVGRSPAYKRRQAFVHGIFLAAFGLAVLSERVRLRDLFDWTIWLPYALMALGLSQILVWESASAVGGGITTALGGLVWYALTREWYGLELSTGWPLFLVAIGVGLMAKTLLAPLFHDARGKSRSTGGPAGGTSDVDHDLGGNSRA